MSTSGDEIDHKYRTLIIMWLILLTAQIAIIGAVVNYTDKAFPIERGIGLLGNEPLIIIGALLLAAFNIAFSFMLKRQSLAYALEEKNVRYLQIGVIVACAMCESVSIFGLILAIAFSYEFYYFWFIISVAAILLHFPRRSEIAAVMK